MPGNGLGDRVHNFFAQDNSLQGQHQSHGPEGNWPVPNNNNSWVGNQNQANVLNSSGKNYTLQNSDIDRGQPSYPGHTKHGLNFSQSNPRPDFATSHSVNEHQNMNGLMYGNQIYQTRQNEANSRGLSAHELRQQNGPEQHIERSPGRPDMSLPSASFDLFGGQHQQMRRQQTSRLNPQQSGVNDMQQLQQQLLLSKMQEYQRQQQFQQQLDFRSQNQINQVSQFPKQTSGSQSSSPLVSGTPHSGASQYPWTTEHGTNWVSSGSTMQGSPSGLVLSPNIGQTQLLMDTEPKQVDQSLYGFPVSSSRGLAVNQYSQTSLPQMSTSGDSFHGNQLNFLPDHIGVQNENSFFRQKSQGENMVEHASNQSLDRGSLLRASTMQRNALPQDFLGRLELPIESKTSNERPTRQVTSSPNEVALDPTEEKILFGSDDNLWDGFSKSLNTSDEAGNLFDNGGLLNGSWSALMQSAVAETSGSDIEPHEELNGFVFSNTDDSSAKQILSIHNDNGKRVSFPDDNMGIHTASRSGSVPPSGVLNIRNVLGSNQLGHKFQNEHGQSAPTDMPLRSMQSLEEAGKWSNQSPLQRSFAETSQLYASNQSVEAERNVHTVTATYPLGQSGTRQQPNGWNTYEAEKLPQNSLNNQLRVMQGEVVRDGTSPFVQNNSFFNQWKNANPIENSQAGEGLGRMLDQVNEHNLGLNSVNSCDKNEVRRREMEIGGVKENSSDSHRSNLSQHAYGDFREGGLPDASGSTPLASAKQKATNKLARKVSGPQMFQYHPMGNLDQDVESTYGLKHPTKVLDSNPRNTHFGQPQIFGQVSRNSSVIDKRQSSELQKDGKGPQEEPSRSSFPGYVPKLSVSFTRPLDSYTPNKDSLPGQNMLELIDKVDQSSDHGAKMNLNSSGCNVSSHQFEAEKSDGSVGRLQRTQSSVSQGFGLQLGPPSQRYHAPDVSSSSQNVQSNVNSMHTSHASARMGEKDQHMVLASSLQSSHFPNGESQVDLKNNRPAAPGHIGNENSLHKMPGNYHAAFNSGNIYPRSQIQNQQMTRVSGEMAMSQHSDSLSGNASHFMQRVSAENVPSDSSRIMHNTWTNVPTPQHAIAAQYQKIRSTFAESLPNIVESSSTSLAQGDVDVSKNGRLSSKLTATCMNSPGVVDGDEQGLKESSGQFISSVNIDSVQKKEESLGEASSIKNQSDGSPGNSASTQNDIEAFGRSLKSSMLSNKKYALLNQMSASKDAKTDPSIRFSKRMKGPDNVHDVDQVRLMAGKHNEHNVIAGDLLGSSTGVPSEDSRMLNFSTPAEISQRRSSPHGNVSPQDTVIPGLHVSRSSPSIDYTTSRVQNSHVSPQMAPSWFNQYGTLKNEQSLLIFNKSVKPAEPPFTLEKSSSVLDTPYSEEKATAVPIDAYQVGSTLQNSSSIPAVNGHLSSPQSSQMNVIGQHQMVSRPKKRKSGTCELQPWHKEMSNGSQNLWTLRLAEADWSKEANRLTEKVEDQSELIEHGVPMLRSKRRLNLTTQLMQQLFTAPPAIILTDDASSKYESVIYAVSRLVLGDACGLVPRSSDLDLPRDGVNRLPAEGKASGGNGDIRSIKVIEDLMRRSRKIENDFLRLKKSASMLDVTLECQDLEKYLVINRFAKFHGRGQDNAETASIDARAAVQRPFPQRYVTALPVPRNLPDRVQCLSL